MTEYEWIACEKVLRAFERDFGRVVADALAQMPEALEQEMLTTLADHTHVFRSKYKEALPVMRTNYGTSRKEVPDFLSL